MVSDYFNFCPNGTHSVHVHTYQDTITFSLYFAVSGFSECLASGSVIDWPPYPFVVDNVLLGDYSLCSHWAGISIQASR